MNIWTIFRMSLYQRRNALLWFALGLATYSGFIAWYYPLIEKVDYSKLMKEFPPEMVEMFAGSMTDLNTFGGFLAVEYLGLMWVIIISAAAIAFATKSLSGDVAGGTMELVLTQPVNRLVLVFARWSAMVVYLATLCLATTVPLWAFAQWKDVEIDTGHLALFTGAGLLLSLAIGGIALALSSAFSESGIPAGVAGGIIVAMWLIAFMSNQAEWAEALNPVNLLHYWSPAEIVNEGTFAASAAMAYTLTAVAGLGTSLAVFAKRDIR